MKAINFPSVKSAMSDLRSLLSDNYKVICQNPIVLRHPNGSVVRFQTAGQRLLMFKDGNLIKTF